MLLTSTRGEECCAPVGGNETSTERAQVAVGDDRATIGCVCCVHVFAGCVYVYLRDVRVQE